MQSGNSTFPNLKSITALRSYRKNTLSNLSVIHTNKTIFSLRKTVFKYETSPFHTRQQQWLTKTTIQNLVSFCFLADPREYVSPGSCEAFI